MQVCTITTEPRRRASLLPSITTRPNRCLNYREGVGPSDDSSDRLQPNCEHREQLIGSPRTIAVASFFTLREGTRWYSARQAVEFGVEIGGGVWFGSRGACCGGYSGVITPKRCVEADYLQRTLFESIAERKLRHRQLTEDENVRSAVGICARAPGKPILARPVRGTGQQVVIRYGSAKHRALLQGAVASHVAQGFSRYRQSY